MQWSDPKAFEIAITALATLGAAFAGAWFAFLLNAREAKRLETERRVRGINEAVFTLCRQYNFLQNFRRKHLDRFRESPGRHLALPTTVLLDYSDWRIDANALSFLFDTELVEWPMRLVLEEERFHSAIKSITARTDFIRDFVDARKQAAGMGHGDTVTLAQLEQTVGPHLSAALKDLTDSMYEHVDLTSASITRACTEFVPKIKAMYPDQRFLVFGPLADLIRSNAK